MRSSRRTQNPRRKIYLRLASQIEGQLRDAYARKHEAGECTQSSLAEKLGINRSAVHHRLNGQTNMTIETIADMVWALGHEIDVQIFDANNERSNNKLIDDQPGQGSWTNPGHPEVKFELAQ